MSGLARAAFIGSMLKCDLKHVVSGAEDLAEGLVPRMSFKTGSRGQDVPHVMLCAAPNPWWISSKLTNDVTRKNLDEASDWKRKS